MEGWIEPGIVLGVTLTAIVWLRVEMRRDQARTAERIDRLSTRIERQERELSARIEEQGRELSARIEERGRELSARIATQTRELGERLSKLEGILEGFRWGRGGPPAPND